MIWPVLEQGFMLPFDKETVMDEHLVRVLCRLYIV